MPTVLALFLAVGLLSLYLALGLLSVILLGALFPILAGLLVVPRRAGAAAKRTHGMPAIYTNSPTYWIPLITIHHPGYRITVSGFT